jgi:hypothetical protein
MADNICVDSVGKIIEKNIEKELYIAKSESMLSLHNFLLKHCLLDTILLRFITILKDRQRNCSTGAQFTFNFYTQCALAKESVAIVISRQAAESSFALLSDDFNSLLNFYAHATLECGLSTRALTPLDVTPVKFADRDTNVGVGVNEDERALYCLGGGTLCDIIKVNKLRCMNKRKLADGQVARSRNMMHAANNLAMTPAEKIAHLPLDLQVRDRGHMTFPKPSFLPYIAKVISSTKNYLSETALETYGCHLLQVIDYLCYSFYHTLSIINPCDVYCCLHRTNLLAMKILHT